MPHHSSSIQMKGRFCYFILALLVVYWVAAATSRTFPPSDGTTIGAHMSGPGQSRQSMKPTSKEGFKNGKEETEQNESAKYKGMGKIGSSPPSCEHKCYGCVPCEAIQVPTTSRHSHLGIQYANYEPEDWKCKCGLSFYSP